MRSYLPTQYHYLLINDITWWTQFTDAGWGGVFPWAAASGQATNAASGAVALTTSLFSQPAAQNTLSMSGGFVSGNSPNFAQGNAFAGMAYSLTIAGTRMIFNTTFMLNAQSYCNEKICLHGKYKVNRPKAITRGTYNICRIWSGDYYWLDNWVCPAGYPETDVAQTLTFD